MEISGNLLGVDIGYDTIKIIELKKANGTNFFHSFGVAAIPARALQENKEEDKKIVGNALQEALKNSKPGKISTRLAISGLPESKVFTKVVQIPAMSEEEMKTAIPSEAARHIPIPPEEAYLDWQYLGLAEKNTLDILVVAAPKILVENYLAVFGSAGLELIAIETKPIAASRSLVKKGEEEAIIILDIGAEATGISVFDLDSIKFTYTLPHGANSFTKTIAQKLGVSEEEAEKIKRKYGFKKEAMEGKILAALQPLMSDILSEVDNAIKFYESRSHPPRKIAQIRTCGGGALTPGISQYITEMTKRKTGVGDPLINLHPKSLKNFPQEEALRFTTAIGLALRERY